MKGVNGVKGMQEVKDYDGNRCDTVRIGEQVWMSLTLSITMIIAQLVGNPFAYLYETFFSVAWKECKLLKNY